MHIMASIFYVDKNIEMTNSYFLLDELQERRSWSAQHGQYLPEVLCTFINVMIT